MSTADLTTRDLIRLGKVFSKARKRSSEIPPLSELMPAIKQAIDDEGELVENLVLVFGTPIRIGLDIVRQVVADDYGKEYAEQLWERFTRRDK